MTLRFSQLVACAVLACATTAAFAAMPQAAAKKALTPQQQRMADCSHQATGKKGDERKAFMSSCLKGHGAAAPATAKATQQEKMKACSAEAKSKSLKGADRKAFMSTCLKGGAAAAAGH